MLPMRLRSSHSNDITACPYQLQLISAQRHPKSEPFACMAALASSSAGKTGFVMYVEPSTPLPENDGLLSLRIISAIHSLCKQSQVGAVILVSCDCTCTQTHMLTFPPSGGYTHSFRSACTCSGLGLDIDVGLHLLDRRRMLFLSLLVLRFLQTCRRAHSYLSSMPTLT